MKKAFLIRGFLLDASAADPDYQEVRSTIKTCGYDVVPVPWTWRHKTMSQYSDQFVDFYQKHKGTTNIVIGHSFGAMAALTSVPRTKPDLLVLCSLSGFFQEDLPNVPADNWIMKHMGKRRRADFESLSADTLAQEAYQNGTKTVLLYGEAEKDPYPNLYNRIQKTAKTLHIKPIEIPKADHSLRAEPYRKALEQILKSN